METTRCVQSSCGNSVKNPCRVCGTLICFICVAKTAVLWKTEYLKVNPNWWCDNCLKANKENVTPNVAEVKEEPGKCKKCGNHQPVSRICRICGSAALYFCVRDDCWNIHIEPLKRGSHTWMCHQCFPNDSEHHSGSKKYKVPPGKLLFQNYTEAPSPSYEIVEEDSESTEAPSPSYEIVEKDSESTEAPSPSCEIVEENWEFLDHPEDLSADRILAMPMERVVNIINDMRRRSQRITSFIEDAIMQVSVYNESEDETPKEKKEKSNSLSVDKVEQFLTSREARVPGYTDQQSEGTEAEKGNAAAGDNKAKQSECVKEQEEVRDEIRVVLDHVLKRCRYIRDGTNEEKKSIGGLQHVEKNEVKKDEHAKHATKMETCSEETVEDEKTCKAPEEAPADSSKNVDFELMYNILVNAVNGVSEEVDNKEAENRAPSTKNLSDAVPCSGNSKPTRNVLSPRQPDAFLSIDKKKSFWETNEPRPVRPFMQLKTKENTQETKRDVVSKLKNKAEGGMTQPSTSQGKKEENKKVDYCDPTLEKHTRNVREADEQIMKSDMAEAYARCLEAHEEFKRVLKFWEDSCTCKK